MVSVEVRIGIAKPLAPLERGFESRAPALDQCRGLIRDHDRVVDDHPQRDDQRRDRELLELDAEVPYDAERDDHAQGNRRGHDYCGTPPHHQERNDEDDQNRLPEILDEVPDQRVDLPRQVVDDREAEVGGQSPVTKLVETQCHLFAHLHDVRAGLHLDAEHDGAFRAHLAVEEADSLLRRVCGSPAYSEGHVAE